jgi:hypothetical protein
MRDLLSTAGLLNRLAVDRAMRIAIGSNGDCPSRPGIEVGWAKTFL